MIIAMVNNKGGVGKTVTSVNLAAALSNRGNKVLLIDNDPQCNATSLLLGDINPDNTLYEVYTQEMQIERCIYPTNFGVDIIPNSQTTSSIEISLYKDTDRSFSLLRNFAREYVKEHYDFVFIDCPPSLGLWVIQAMSCADGVIVPIEAGSRFSLDGLASIYAAIEDIRETQINNKLVFLKTLVNKVDLRTSSSKAILERVKQLYPGNVFSTTIPTNDPVKQAELARTTCIKYAPSCNASLKYRQLAIELEELVKSQEQNKMVLTDD